MTTPHHDDGADGRPPHAGKRPALGLLFWLVMAFGLACILAGFAVAAYGPKLFPARPKAPISRAAPPPAAASGLAPAAGPST